MTEMGEYLVGAYLKLVLDCNLAIYNQRIEKQREIDVIGLNTKRSVAYLCEVATHLEGLNYGESNEHTIKTLFKKIKAFHEYGEKNLPGMKTICMLWSPYVPVGYLTDSLAEMEKQFNFEVEFVINEKYASEVNELRKRAKKETKKSGEPFYRALQILEHLRQPNAWRNSDSNWNA